jgi:hypothetical protein
MPVAYPLPYGEYLAETEALQLLTAHDLYNELRNLIASVQVRLGPSQMWLSKDTVSLEIRLFDYFICSLFFAPEFPHS